MFKRIKNLLDISRYTVEELKNPTYVIEESGYIHVAPNRPASIINIHADDPFKDIADETTQQSPDDTTARD